METQLWHMEASVNAHSSCTKKKKKKKKINLKNAIILFRALFHTNYSVREDLNFRAYRRLIID